MKVEIQQQDCVVTITAPIGVVKVLATILTDVDLMKVETQSSTGKELCPDLRQLGLDMKVAIKETPK